MEPKGKWVLWTRVVRDGHLGKWVEYTDSNDYAALFELMHDYRKMGVFAVRLDWWPEELLVN